MPLIHLPHYNDILRIHQSTSSIMIYVYTVAWDLKVVCLSFIKLKMYMVLNDGSGHHVVHHTPASVTISGYSSISHIVDELMLLNLFLIGNTFVNTYRNMICYQEYIQLKVLLNAYFKNTMLIMQIWNLVSLLELASQRTVIVIYITPASDF